MTSLLCSSKTGKTGRSQNDGYHWAVVMGEHSGALAIFICGLTGGYMGIYYVSKKNTAELYAIKICVLYSKLYFN